MRLHFLPFVLIGVALGCGGVGEEPIGSQAQACHQNHADDIITNDHFVTVSNGAILHVVEKYTASALHGGRRRALMMLPATLVTTAMWNAAVPDRPEFNGLDRAAREGYLSYTLDYEGYGLSSQPSDGKEVTTERLVRDVGDVIRWIRHRRHAPKVDLLGASLGASIAVWLGGKHSPIPRRWISHVVLAGNVYKTVTPFAQQAFLNPQTEAFFLSMPNGYVDTFPDVYTLPLVAADPAAQAWGMASFSGHYAVGPTLAGFHLPPVDAHDGRAPMLQFWGDQDMITPLSDAQQFQSEYGGPGTLVVLNGGSHSPQFEAVRDQFWSNTFAFLDDDDDDDDDDE